MTAALNPRPNTRRGGANGRPDLRMLDQAAIRRRARRRNAAVFLFLSMLCGLFLVALVHAQLVERQQELDVLRGQIVEAEAELARTERAVNEASSPARIVDRASQLGMVPAAEPLYLTATRDVGDG